MQRSMTIAVTCILGLCGKVSADEVLVAVAANFTTPLRVLEEAFERIEGYELRVSYGSTGQLYAQIVNGAPFDIFLAADQERPRQLAMQGRGEFSSIFTYAVGRLALWSAEPDRLSDADLSAALTGEFRWFAIAEPAVAPYGAAARQVLQSLGVWATIQPRLVRGQNIAQTFSMIATGNAELGLIALSQARDYDGRASYVVVPENLHEPLHQDGILLNRGRENPGAIAFMRFLRTAAATGIIEEYGYSVVTDAEP